MLSYLHEDRTEQWLCCCAKKINSGFSRNSTDAALTFLLISKVLFHYIVVKIAKVFVLLLLH